MIKVKGVAVLIQFSRIFYIFFMSLALGINIPFIHFCVFLPIIMLLLMLPISVGGIGVQEAAFIYFFVPLGMGKEEAVSLSLLCYTAVILWLLVGWVIYAKEGIGGRKGALREINTNGYAN